MDTVGTRRRSGNRVEEMMPLSVASSSSYRVRSGWVIDLLCSLISVVFRYSLWSLATAHLFASVVLYPGWAIFLSFILWAAIFAWTMGDDS